VQGMLGFEEGQEKRRQASRIGEKGRSNGSAMGSKDGERMQNWGKCYSAVKKELLQ